MKKLMIAASVLATLAATPALADGNNRNTDTENFTLRANNPAKCNLEAADYTLRLPNNSLTDNQGVALGTIGTDVANVLNGAGVTAWCTGNSNTLQMYRTAFTIGNGDQLVSGFNQAAVYDVTMAISDAVRSDGFTPVEGTSDGQGHGPGHGIGGALTVSRFGPSAAGTPVIFAQETGQTSTAVTNASAAGTGATSAFTASTNRLVAGQYVSTLTIELTPGV